jgi:hypothetical protein
LLFINSIYAGRKWLEKSLWGCHFRLRRLGWGILRNQEEGCTRRETREPYCITELVILAAVVVIWNAMVISSHTISVETEGGIERCCAIWGSVVTWCLIRERKN